MNYLFIDAFFCIAIIFAAYFLIDQIIELKKANKELEELEAENLEKLNISKERREIDLTQM